MDSSTLINNQTLSLFNRNQNQLLLDNDDVILKVKKIISSVISNRDAWPFREPVKVQDALNYYEIIKKPMDLSKIIEKINSKIYTNFLELEDDFRLIVTNCEQYNGQFNGFTTNVYACWRLFRKLTKKYLDHDLSLEDHQAFLFPPRYNSNKKIVTSNAAAKRKKRKKSKKSNKFLALELLYNATQDSIESTFQKFAFSPFSDNENKTNNDLLPKKYQFNNLNIKEEKDLLIDTIKTEIITDGLTENYSYQNGFYTEENRNENLIFKSLNDWNKQIDENGQSVVLPDKAVIVKNSPVDQNWLTNFQNDQINYKKVFNKFLHEEVRNGILDNSQLIINSKNSINSKEPRTKKCKENSKNHDNLINKDTNNSTNTDNQDDDLKQNTKKRLVIKLSKLNNWKKFNLTETKLSNEESGSESDSSDSSTSSSSCSSNSDN